MGLAVCLRAPSAALAEVVIFSCARPPEEMEGAWMPLFVAAAVVLDMESARQREAGARGPINRVALRERQWRRVRARELWAGEEGVEVYI